MFWDPRFREITIFDICKLIFFSLLRFLFFELNKGHVVILLTNATTSDIVTMYSSSISLVYFWFFVIFVFFSLKIENFINEPQFFWFGTELIIYQWNFNSINHTLLVLRIEFNKMKKIKFLALPKNFAQEGDLGTN